MPCWPRSPDANMKNPTKVLVSVLQRGGNNKRFGTTRRTPFPFQCKLELDVMHQDLRSGSESLDGMSRKLGSWTRSTKYRRHLDIAEQEPFAKNLIVALRLKLVRLRIPIEGPHTGITMVKHLFIVPTIELSRVRLDSNLCY